ncbi:PREDICTED: endothelial cell-specific chemotaxis regulator isoform X2 [Dipodomys ordii]|uniref:Endothelial cell-specific chemotaxis regulator isoform X2 n=1 Tax=Dipodomys ordii TaxID=10020 RepID=A0A1S3FIB2_DIPOR|nr:PREDICTED: endothelial cell-specific chemotaxis regulator isoform X2 [Dipodomys ordii]
MGTTGATQLFWAILGLLLLQGHNSQPTTTQTSQGVFNSLRLTIEATLPNTGVPQEASWSSPVSPKPVVLRSSTVDGHSPPLLGLTQPQTQKLTSGLETSQNATPSSITMSLRTRGNLTIVPSPTSETVLTVAAFGVISFIVILVVVVIVLVGVVSLRFKCRKNKEPEDPQKPGNSGVSESCSTANGEKDSITLISVKNINMNNSKGCPSAEKVL